MTMQLNIARQFLTLTEAGPFPTREPAGPGMLAGLRRSLAVLRKRRHLNRKRRRDRDTLVELLALEDHLLSDIGLSRHEIIDRLYRLDAGRS